MGLFGGSKTKSKTKPTLLTRIGGANLISAFLPWGSASIENEDIAKRAFPGGMPPSGSTSEIGADSTFAPYRRYVENYNPYSYPGTRPGGMSDAETSLLNNSLYGRQAPLDMSGMNKASSNYSDYINALLNYGGAPGSGVIENLGRQAQNAIGYGNSYYDRPPERPDIPNAPDFDAATYARRILDTIGGNGELDKYVTGATEGMRKEYERTLAEQQADLESKYNYEGGYLSSPMFAAKGQLTGELTSNYLKDMGLMQLDAANRERDRMYNLAGQGIGTQGNYLSSTYGTGVGALADMYGTEAGLFGKLMGDTSSARASIINNAMQLLEKGYASSFDQAEKMATALQQNQQGGLDKLHEDYYQPGENMLQILSLLMGLPYKQKSKTSGGGGLGEILGGAGDLLTGAHAAGLLA